jgi:hypothetical protein
MGEILIQIIVEFFLEFVVQIVGEVFVEIGFQKLSGAPWPRKAWSATPALILYCWLGVLTGGFSLLIFPHSFIRSSRLHGISLIITPLLAGLTMSGIGWLRERHGKPLIRLDTFAYGFIFAFGMALVRLLFTT